MPAPLESDARDIVFILLLRQIADILYRKDSKAAMDMHEEMRLLLETGNFNPLLLDAFESLMDVVHGVLLHLRQVEMQKNFEVRQQQWIPKVRLTRGNPWGRTWKNRDDAMKQAQTFQHEYRRVNNGQTPTEAKTAEHLGISDSTWYRWRRDYRRTRTPAATGT